MKEKYIPGEGCECSARCSCECGCDVDWTPREVYELRRQRDMLAGVAQAVWDRWETPLWKDHPPTALVMNKLRDALAAAKGGSDE
jgi:hypothetical protein